MNTYMASVFFLSLAAFVLVFLAVPCRADADINFYFADMLRGVDSGSHPSYPNNGGSSSASDESSAPNPAQRLSCKESPVIVVGAGWSGMTTAIELKKRGCKVLLLEGQSRVGGRSYTVNSEGSIVEFGSNWVHGRVGHPFIPFMESLGFNTSDPRVLLKVDQFGNETFEHAAAVIGYPGVWLSNGTLLSNASIDHSFEVNREWEDHIYQALSERSADGKNPLYQPDDVPLLLGELVSPSVNNWKRNLTLQEIGFSNWHRNNVYHEDFAASIEQISLFNFNPLMKYYDGGNNVIPFGYTVIANKYAEYLNSSELYLNTLVTKIEHTPTGATVYTANGTVHHGSTAVVTVPLGVLKQDVITFDPPVPSRIARAISLLDMGLLDKIWLKFESAFWDTSNYAWFLLPDTNHPDSESFITTFFSALYEQRPGTNQNVLGFFVGANADYKLYLSDQEIIDRSMAVFRTVFGNDIPEPIDVIRTNWTNSPWTHGIYSYPRTHAAANSFDDFIVTDPNSSLHFAGEHTSRTGFGFQYGAQATGYREARSIAGMAENVKAGIVQMSEEEYKRLAGHPDEGLTGGEEAEGGIKTRKRGESSSCYGYTPYEEARCVYEKRKAAGLVRK